MYCVFQAIKVSAILAEISSFYTAVNIDGQHFVFHLSVCLSLCLSFSLNSAIFDCFSYFSNLLLKIFFTFLSKMKLLVISQ